jgi:hypothetical protein
MNPSPAQPGADDAEKREIDCPERGVHTVHCIVNCCLPSMVSLHIVIRKEAPALLRLSLTFPPNMLCYRYPLADL